MSEGVLHVSDVGAASRQTPSGPGGAAARPAWGGDRLHELGGSYPGGDSQKFQVQRVRVIPCAKSDVDEDKVVSWSIIAISFF